jgi:N utilization substance protein B
MALQLIYELDLRKDISPAEAIDMYPFAEEEPEAADYAKQLVMSTSECVDEIDQLLRRYIVGWGLERMVAVDRAAIRIALCEGMLKQTVPVAVAISEAVELTKVFGTIESSKFVNGVLGRIVRNVMPESGSLPDEDAAIPDVIDGVAPDTDE